ncbi:metallophosphoesterase family protein [Brachybacterium hainanense]|uniref:Metallophosphoesterase family protein n=1 Tax=Brachybacterium hainanense TaxID=1541174 RepID=A0ABV6RAM5_9MICO
MSGRIFFTADTHFGHRLMALLRGFGPPGAQLREDIGPEHMAAHDEELIARWNATVDPEDVVWHLGDLTLKTAAEVAPLIHRLHGSIRVILGNHDRAHPMLGERSVTAQQELLAAGVDYVATSARITIDGGSAGRLPVLLSHFPYRDTSRADDRFVAWRMADDGEVLLHGHTHRREVTAPSWNRQIHVGWDAWGEPVPEQEVRLLIRGKGRRRS